MQPFYDPSEARLNQVASGVALFVATLARALQEFDQLPPEGRTGTALLDILESCCRTAGEIEAATTESLDHAQTMFRMVAALFHGEELEET